MLILALMTWIIRYIEAYLNIPPAMATQIRNVMVVAYNVIAGMGILTITWINLSINGAFSQAIAGGPMNAPDNAILSRPLSQAWNARASTSITRFSRDRRRTA